MTVTLLLTLFTGCSGSQDALDLNPLESKESVSDKSVELTPMPPDLLSKGWNVRLADDTARYPFETSGWEAYAKGKFEHAVQLMEGPSLARVHAEISALYRQALLMHAHSAYFIYGEMRQPADAAESGYLFGAATLVLNQMDKAKEALSPFVSSENQTLQQNAKQLLAFINGPKKEPLELTGFFFDAEGVSINKVPKAGEEIHYAFETSESGVLHSASEGFSLWRRALWHEQTAKRIMDTQSATVDLWIQPWRLPFETPIDGFNSIKLEDSWLFGGFYLVSDDALFLADARTKGIDSISEWKTKSILANALQSSLVDGKVDVDIVNQRAISIEAECLDLIKSKTNAVGLYKPFASYARYAVLRAGVVVADANGQYRDAGKLRLLVREAEGLVRDPLFMVGLAAWDAGNQNPLRPQEIIHKYSDRYPALQSARLPLDALHIRLGRNSTSSGPAH